MTIEELETRKKTLIRLPGCILYEPGANGKRVLGGRAVYLDRTDATSGLAVYSRRVVKVTLINKDSYRSRMPQTYDCAYADRKNSYERTIRLSKIEASTMERRLKEWKPVQVKS